MKDASLDITGDGINAKVGEVSTGGVTVENAKGKVGIGDGAVTAEASVGKVDTNTSVKGAELDISGGGLKAKVDEVSTGGVTVEKAKGSLDIGDGAVKADASVGKVDTNTSVKGAELDVSGDGIKAKVDEVSTGGVTVEDVNGSVDIGDGTVTAEASMGKFDNNTVVEGASVDLGPDGLEASVDKVKFGGIDVEDVSAKGQIDGIGSAEISAGKISTSNTAEGGSVKIGADGIDAKLDKLDYGSFGAEDVKAKVDLGKVAQMQAEVKKAAVQNLQVEGAKAHVGMDGISASVDKASYDGVRLEGVKTSQNIGDGLLKSGVAADEFTYMSGSAKDIHAGIDKDGLSVGAKDVKASWFGGKGLEADVSMLDGAVGVDAKIGEGSLVGGTLGNIQASSNLKKTDINIDDLNVHGFKGKDISANANIGDINANVGAKELEVLNANVGNAQAHLDNFGTKGNASVSDVDVRLLKADDLQAGIGFGDTTIAGAKTDVDAGATLKRADAQYDLFKGQASASVEDLKVGASLRDTEITLFGQDIPLPDIAFEVEADANAEVDLGKGRVAAGLSLAGSEFELGPLDIELGEWAQVGAEIDLSEGQFNLNLFGADIDVDEGVKWLGGKIADGWDTMKSWGSKAWGGIKSFGSSVWSGAKNLGSKMWSGIKGFGSSIWGGAKNLGSSIFSAAKGLGSKVWSFGKGIGSKLWGGAKNLGSKLWGGAKSLGSKMWGGIKSLGSSAWSGVKSIGSSIWGGAKSLGSKLWGGAKSVGSKLWGSAKSLGSSLWSGAKSLGSKMWGGAKSAGKALLGKASALGSKLWGSAKSLGSSVWSGVKSRRLQRVEQRQEPRQRHVEQGQELRWPPPQRREVGGLQLRWLGQEPLQERLGVPSPARAARRTTRRRRRSPASGTAPRPRPARPSRGPRPRPRR